MIRIANLDFWYSKKRSLFNNLNLDLEKGKIHGILGLNGTGKSTLLKLIAGNLFAKNGKVSILDSNISHRHASILQDIYFLAEEINTPSISMTKYIKTHASFYPQFSTETFTDILTAFTVPLTSKLNRLSYGQKKKVMIAFGLATNAKIIVMDEPTNGLDIPSKSQFRKIMARELKDDQMVIISTHQVRDLGQMLDSVVILNQGDIIFNQDIQKIEQTLLFEENNSADQNPGSIYTEKNIASYVHISPNKEKLENEIHLEVLFNAITQHSDLIIEQFNS